MFKIFTIFLLLNIDFIFAKSLNECKEIVKVNAYLNLKVPCPWNMNPLCKLAKNDNSIKEQCYLMFNKEELDQIYKKTVEKIKSDQQNKLFMIMADDLENKK